MDNPTPPNGRGRDRALAIAGVAGLVLGAGPLAAVPFGLAMRNMERRYRAQHGFDGTFEERLARSVRFYETTHTNGVNRALHMVGNPVIAASTLGLAMSSPFRPLSWPLYAPSLVGFVSGWAANLVGHFGFEKNRPAFEEDPLSFIAGPVWEIGLLTRRVRDSGKPKDSAGESAVV